MRPVYKPPRWRKIPRGEYHRAEAFLKTREKFCVAACARFLRILGGASALSNLSGGSMENRGHVWYMSGQGDEISALLLHNRRYLFPVFDKNLRIPGPRFLSRFLGKVPIHALQGLRGDAELLETLMEDQGYFASERIDYYLMGLDNASRTEVFRDGPGDLVLRSPMPKDEEYLFSLQSAYEKEEVLPENAAFNAAACRLNLQHILFRERILVAELGGQVVGKINTSAESFTRYLIGGVYVRPDCRGIGIGTKMTAVFARNLLALERGLTLFVKKSNISACKVYRKAGFDVLADYRITYY